MKKTISKKMEKMPSPNLVGSPKISVHWSVNSQRGQKPVLAWQLLKQLEHVGLHGGCVCGEVFTCPESHKPSSCKCPWAI